MKIFLTVFSLSLVSSDPATDLNKCLEMGENMDLCLQITMSAFKKFMKTGVAEAGLPPLDPLVLDSVDFSLAGAKLTFSNLTAVGLSQHTAEQVEYERATRRLKMSLAIPRLATAGQYSLQGNILNVRGLDSNGPYRNEYSGVRVEGWAELVPGTEKGVSVGDMKLALNVERIKSACSRGRNKTAARRTLSSGPAIQSSLKPSTGLSIARPGATAFWTSFREK